MDQVAIGPCQTGVQPIQIILAIFTGFNMLLTTWLTMRARRKDVEANGKH